MNFLLWNRQRDPMVKFVRPLVDPRLHQIDPSIERIWRERVAANKARRDQKKVIDQIEAEYRNELPDLLRIQAD